MGMKVSSFKLNNLVLSSSAMPSQSIKTTENQLSETIVVQQYPIFNRFYRVVSSNPLFTTTSMAILSLLF